MDCIHSVQEYCMRMSVLTPEATTAVSIPHAPVNTGSFSRARAPVKLERREYCFNSSFLTTDHINHSYVFLRLMLFFFLKTRRRATYHNIKKKEKGKNPNHAT